MPYSVQLAAVAHHEAEDYYLFILKQSYDSLAADAWWNGLLDALDTLRSFPPRCQRIPEQDKFEVPLHQLLYASHRIIFRTDGDLVRVVRIYHSALRPLAHLRQRPRHGKPQA